MHSHRKEPDKIIRAGGKEFLLYKYYEEMCGDYIIEYPDFKQNPEYTAEGMPFELAVEESCEYGQSGDAENPDPGFCIGCVHFSREPPPNDAIGVCVCESLRRKSE